MPCFLPKELVNEVKDTVTTLANALREHLSQFPPNLSLSSGLSSAWLFLEYLSHESWSRRGAAIELADLIIEKLETEALSPGLIGGLAGVGWVLEHLDHESVSSDEVNAIDLGLAEWTSSKAGSKEFDFVRGLVGVGVYGLERGRRGKGLDLVTKVLSSLKRMRAQDSALWFRTAAKLSVAQRILYPEGLYDAGVAHGISGIIGFLAAVARQDSDSNENTVSLLRTTVRQFLSLARVNEEQEFPNYFNGELRHVSKPAWCYGSTGAACVLANAAQVCERSDWFLLACEIGYEALRSAEAPDACLCHGFLGHTHIARRFYELSGDVRFVELALAHLKNALALRSSSFEPYEFRSARLVGQRWALDDSGFLTGVSGMGLALLATISDRTPAWDRLLLLR